MANVYGKFVMKTYTEKDNICFYLRLIIYNLAQSETHIKLEVLIALDMSY